MIIEPKVRDYICTTAHPEGCKANVKAQIAYVKAKGKMEGAKKVLVIGASTGYGLATRIAATFGCEADTLGIMFEKPGTARRTATAGWYNTKAFEKMAQAEGRYAKTINGDAFSKKVKEEAIALIKADLGKVDLVIYSLAAPRRQMADGTVYKSVLKTVGEPFENKNLDLKNNAITRAAIAPATEEEIAHTVKVMGGEDWKDWMEALSEADVLEEGAKTIAFSYIGPELTYPIYYQGSIGAAKAHLYDTSLEITKMLSQKDIKAYISVNKALVTQASSAIPVVPLYITLLYKIMKEKGLHEGCIEQMDRLLRDKLNTLEVDEMNRIRLDDYEMQPEVQKEVMENWDKVTTENIDEFADIKGYWEDFYHMFGFGFEEVDYSQDIDLEAANE